MKHLRRTGDDGLTLIELVIAMVILTFGVITAMSVLVHAQSSTEATSAKTMALNAAQEQFEIIFSFTPSSVRNFDGITFAVGDLVGPAGGEPGLIAVSGTEPRVVTITVTWQGQGIRPGGQLTMTALRSEAMR